MLHPELGYFDEGAELTDAGLYEGAMRPYGEASLLPPVAYRSKVFSDLEDEKLWTRAWVTLGMTQQLPRPGDLLPFTVGHHGIHVQRDLNGGLTGRFNKAQHGGCRAVPLQCQTGVKTKCSFTSCGFSRDREAISTSELDDSAAITHQYLGLVPERLLPVKIDTWGPFVFANLDHQAGSLLDDLGRLPQLPKAHVFDALRVSALGWFECSANWKLFGRAFCEAAGQQCSGEVEFEGGSDFGTCSVVAWNDGPQTAEGLLAWVYPNLFLAVFASHVAVFIAQPLGMTSTRVRYFLLVSEGSSHADHVEAANLDRTWRQRFESVSLAAVESQTRLGAWGTALNPDTAGKEMPIEESRSGYDFQRYLAKKILAEHSYYWASPLYGSAT